MAKSKYGTYRKTLPTKERPLRPILSGPGPVGGQQFQGKAPEYGEAHMAKEPIARSALDRLGEMTRKVGRKVGNKLERREVQRPPRMMLGTRG